MNQTKERNKIMQVNVQSVIGYRLSHITIIEAYLEM